MPRKVFSFLFIMIGVAMQVHAQPTFPLNGVEDERHLYYAFTNARIYVDEQTIIPQGTLLIRDGRIEAVGKEVPIPAGAVIRDLKGKFIYPGLIDMYSDYGIAPLPRIPAEEGPHMISSRQGAFSWNQAIRPDQDASEMFRVNEKAAAELRKSGFTAVLSLQTDGIARGSAACVLLGSDPEQMEIIKAHAVACYSFDRGSSIQDYPESLMGAVALLRQTYLDGQWYRQADPSDRKFNLSLEAWNNLQNLPQIFEVSDVIAALRADRIGTEFGKQYIIKGAGDEYRRLQELADSRVRMIIPLDFPLPFNPEDEGEADQISISDMRFWDQAPSNPARLEKKGIPFAFTTYGLKDKADFMKNLRKAIARGLSREQALRSLTKTPAEWLQMSDQIGSLSKNKIANFLITSGDLFDENTLLCETWIRGRSFRFFNPEMPDIRGRYLLRIEDKTMGSVLIEGKADHPEVNWISLTDTSKRKAIIRMDDELRSIRMEIQDDKTGIKFVLEAVLKEPSDSMQRLHWEGLGKENNIKDISWSADRVSLFQPAGSKNVLKDSVKLTAVAFPDNAFGWFEKPLPLTTLIQNVTIWTNESEGVRKESDVLISGGKITKIGTHLEVPAGTVIVNGKGKHLTPGIVDEHSHIAICGRVNEGSQAVSAEVRVGDVVDPNDVQIYRQLAGGVTCAQLLHGSANPIGGQSALIKLRWGFPPEAMKIAGADGFIKCALGENVKQSNWGDHYVQRFPQSRMGVEQVFADAFTRAKDYMKKMEAFQSAATQLKGAAPRRDLELEAVAEILRGKRFITCHSYRQSEINMLLKLGDSLGFKVNTLTHILEGYKLADKIKQRGVGAATFADWWAYKLEVMDAIPYNGAVLHDMGVVTAFNSDDPEMARRLNEEAAKAVKYGGVPDTEALKFVTLNPAKLLHLDHRLGSVKEGKDADLVLWSSDPLSVYSKVEKTWVDGICFYDRAKDESMAASRRKERELLVEKMRNALKNGEKSRHIPRPGKTIGCMTP